MTIYNAFVSYSHSADGRLAPAVRTGLERLAKPWNRRRALRIFQDTSGLAVTPKLWETIRDALDGSDFFVLASPEAAESRWVNQEVAHFLEQHQPDRVLLVVTGGDCVWNAAAGRFDEAASTALPEAVKTAFPQEPKFLDLRWAREDDDLDLANTRFRGAMGDLAAPIHGLPRDELDAEDLREFRKARRVTRLAIAALAVLTVAAIGLGVAALVSAGEAREQTALANANAAEARDQTALAELNAGEAREQTARAERALADLEEANGTLEELDVQIAVAQQELDDLTIQRDAAVAESSSRRLATQALAALDRRNPIGAYQLALSAYWASPTTESIDALYTAATHPLPVGDLQHGEVLLVATAVDPAGSYLAVGTNDGSSRSGSFPSSPSPPCSRPGSPSSRWRSVPTVPA